MAAGSAVCGAAAVLAVAPAVKAQPRETAVAIASVVLFGTIGIFLYPWLYALVTHAGMAVAPASPLPPVRPRAARRGEGRHRHRRIAARLRRPW